MTNDKLAEALRTLEAAALSGVMLHGDDIPRLHATADCIAPLAAEAAHTRIPDLTDDEWMILFHERPDLKDRLNAIFDKTAYLSRYRSQCKTSTEAAQAQAQAAEPVAEMGEGGLVWHKSFSPRRHAGTKFYTHLQPAQDAKDAALLEWAVSRWNAEVLHRPLVNVHRRTLDDTWRQVIRHAGGDDVVICGPRHDDLVAMAKESGR